MSYPTVARNPAVNMKVSNHSANGLMAHCLSGNALWYRWFGVNLLVTVMCLLISLTDNLYISLVKLKFAILVQETQSESFALAWPCCPFLSRNITSWESRSWGTATTASAAPRKSGPTTPCSVSTWACPWLTPSSEWTMAQQR